MSPFEAEPLMLFDRRAHRLHRERAARLGGGSFLHGLAAGWLIDRLDDIPRPFGAALVLGAQDGLLSPALARRSGTDWVVSADPCLPLLRRQRGTGVVVDPELAPFRHASFDLAVSALTLHWVADLPGTLSQLRRVLRPDGLFLAAMLGGDTLAELRAALIEAELAEEGGASPRVSPMAGLADVAALLQRAGFAMPVADTDRVVVTYPDMLALMRELRGMGETNALSARRRTPLRRGTLARAAAFYAERHGCDDGRIAATFDIFCLTGWAPDASQPQPLPPGSAAYRLADALGTVELAAGDPVPVMRRRSPRS
jgi:SAM-dependent methyltransferase